MCGSVQKNTPFRGIFTLRMGLESAWMQYRSMMELIAEFHLEPWFEAHLGGATAVTRRGSRGDPAFRYPKKSAISSAQELAVLLRQLGVRADTPALRCFALVDGATARAAESIAAWMNYLPQDCVEAMVRDGWHWST